MQTGSVTTLVQVETLRTWEELLAIREILKAATQAPVWSNAQRQAAIALLTDIDEAMRS